jgi:hypothetical protein
MTICLYWAARAGPIHPPPPSLARKQEVEMQFEDKVLAYLALFFLTVLSASVATGLQ